MIRKRHITLIELLVAFGLMVMVMSTLGFFFRQVLAINQQMVRIENDAFQRLYLQYRLADTLPKAVMGKKEYFFSSPSYLGMFQGASLVFSYDNGVDLDKEFSNVVLGRLFVDENRRLILSTWPSPSRWSVDSLPPVKKEVLMENVDEMLFSFFIPPSDEEQKDTLQPEPKGGWINDWLLDYKRLPAIVQVMVIHNGDQIRLSYPLVNVKQEIIYQQ